MGAWRREGLPVGVTMEPSPVSGGRVTRPVRSGWGGGGGPGGDLGVGKARPGPWSDRALPEHPAEVAVPRVAPRCGQGRWPVCLAVVGGEGRLGSSSACWLVTAACVVVWPPRPRWCVCACATFSGEGGHKGGSTRAQTRVYGCWRVVYGPSTVPWRLSLRLVSGRPRGTAGGGVEVWAGRVGSGGRPRRRRRHAGAGPVAVARRCGRAGRRPAVSPSAPHCGVGGRAGGKGDARVGPRGAHVQGVGVPDEGLAEACGTRGKQVALPGGRGRGRACG